MVADSLGGEDSSTFSSFFENSIPATWSGMFLKTQKLSQSTTGVQTSDGVTYIPVRGNFQNDPSAPAVEPWKVRIPPSFPPPEDDDILEVPEGGEKIDLVPQPNGTVCRWRNTGGCSPFGPREPERDLGCDDTVKREASGYCECEGSPNLSYSCGHPIITCRALCAKYKEIIAGDGPDANKPFLAPPATPPSNFPEVKIETLEPSWKLLHGKVGDRQAVYEFSNFCIDRTGGFFSGNSRSPDSRKNRFSRLRYRKRLLVESPGSGEQRISHGQIRTQRHNAIDRRRRLGLPYVALHG